MPLWLRYSVVCFLFSITHANAQLRAGITTRLGYPFDVQKQGFYNTPSIGLGLDLSYELAKSNLFPSVVYSFNSMQMPIYSKAYNDLNARAMLNYLDVNLNFKLKETEYVLIFNGGLTIGRLLPDPTNVQQNANGSPLVLKSDGNKYLSPGMNAGLQYMRQFKSFKSIYAGLEATLTYLYVFENTNYHISNDNYYEDILIPKYMLFPAIAIRLQWEFVRDND